MSRLEFSRKVRRSIIERAKGCCEACSAKLKAGEGEVDHILPDALGGKPEAANGWLLCRVCHVEKTRVDVGRIRKADRQRDRATGAIRAKQRIKSAGFPRTRAPRAPKPTFAGRRVLYRTGQLSKPLGGEDLGD